MDLLWAAHYAVVAGDTDPWSVAAQYFLAHTCTQHGKQHARRVIHIYRCRARPAARSTLDAHLQMRNASRFHADFTQERKILLMSYPRSNSLIGHMGHNLSNHVALSIGKRNLDDLVSNTHLSGTTDKSTPQALLC